MSDIRKWLTIMESVPATFPQESPKRAIIKQDATVMVNPRIGGGTGRYMHSTPRGAMVDIKGVPRELSEEDFSLPQRDYEDGYEKGNDWFHMTQEPDSIGRMNDKPEFRPGDMVKVADVYGSVIGPGFGVFVAYGTTGKDCIISFDNKEIVVPIENVGSVLEQSAKDKFGEMDNDGNLSPMSLGSDNRVKVEIQEPAMDHRDEFSKWMETVEEALTGESKTELEEDMPPLAECGCGSWDCTVCFPDQNEMPGMNGALAGIGGAEHPMDAGACPTCGHVDAGCGHEREPESFNLEPMGLEMDGLEEYPMEDEDSPEVMAFKAKGGQVQQLPYMNRPRNPGSSFGSKHIGSASGRETTKGALRGANASVGTRDKPSGKPVVGEEDSVDLEHGVTGAPERPRSGKGVKLGDIIKHPTEFRRVGQESPLTYGEENLGEGDWYNPDKSDVEMDPDWTEDDVGFGDHEAEQRRQAEFATQSDRDIEGAEEMMHKIMYMQDRGLSKSGKVYTQMDFQNMGPSELKKAHDAVMGTVSEDDMEMPAGGAGPTTGSMDAGPSQGGGASGGVKYAPGTAPTMPESINHQGKKTMENVDTDISTWLGRFKAYDELRASKAPVMEKKKEVKEEEDKNPWEKLASDKKEEEPKTHKTAKGGTVTKTEKGLTHKGTYGGEKEDKKDVKEAADPEILEWMGRFAKLGNMKGYGR